MESETGEGGGGEQYSVSKYELTILHLDGYWFMQTVTELTLYPFAYVDYVPW